MEPGLMPNEVEITPAATQPLFDPAVADPPPDVIELYLEAPLSVGLLYRLAAEDEAGELRHYLPLIEEAWEAGAAAALKALANNTVVKVGNHYPGSDRATIGRREPARLFLTRVRHVGVAGHEATACLHDHVYLGRSGVSTADGRRYPLCLDTFPTTVEVMDAVYRGALQRSLTATAGAEWSEPVHGERSELVEPPLRECLPDHPRVLCHWHPPLAQRWVVGDARQRRDNPFLLDNRAPGESRPGWDAIDDPYWAS